MRLQILPALMLLLLMTLLTGIVYPLLVTALAAVIAPEQARGSLVHGEGGRILGSELVGQSWDDPRWFWGRPSATSPSHDAAASSGSNTGPTNPALAAAVAARVAALKAADPGQRAPIPVDLVTASGSGLDPHVSPEAARWQTGRVARTRGLDPERVRALVEAHVEGRTLGLIGEPRVNVLRLNLALESLR